ncbi:hypothetical protein A2335_01135 [Candidatus Peregrinibacteria bacterium RIFOXYB2_FULL_32_7]|nr:MAG: hypothetical protein A2335_01135 [Candidatus Peregrinibacteria bacterium RIFOXYB2_FULL_32_7]
MPQFLLKISILGLLLLPLLHQLLEIQREINGKVASYSYAYENFHESSSSQSEINSANLNKDTINFEIIALPCPNKCFGQFAITGAEILENNQIEQIIHFQSLLQKTLTKIPYNLWQTLTKITFSFEENIARGTASSKQIKMRIINIEDEEFVSVLIHELGHIADLGALNGDSKSGVSRFPDGRTKTFKDDLSVEFYSNYWITSKQIKTFDNDKNFISGYSQTDCFEHFAETFLTYILHSELLKTRNQAQYNYFKNTVFQNIEYENFSKVPAQSSGRQNSNENFYDATLLDYDFENFLN